MGNDRAMERLNYFWPDVVLKSGSSYYISRPWFLNELTNEFDVQYFCSVRETESIDTEKYSEIDSKVEVRDFFDHFSLKKFLVERRKFDKRIEETCSRENDYFFVMYPYNQISIGLTWLLNDTKLALWVKGRLLESFKNYPEDPLHKRLLKASVKPALRITYPNITKQLLDDNLVFYTGEKIFDTENNITQFSITSVSRLNRNEELKKTELNDNIVFIGDESRLKGLGYLLNIFKDIERNVDLTIIGVEELEKYSEYEEHPRINVKGEIYNEQAFYEVLSKHDILVMPSGSESQGKVQLEAMSAGVVPICADVGGVHTIVQNMYNGLLFDRSKPEQVPELIDTLYEHPDLYSQLVENGWEYTKRHSIERQVEIMATAIRNYYGDYDLQSLYT